MKTKIKSSNMKEYTFFFWDDTGLYVHRMMAPGIGCASIAGLKVRAEFLGDVGDDPRWQCAERKMKVHELKGLYDAEDPADVIEVANGLREEVSLVEGSIPSASTTLPCTTYS